MSELESLKKDKFEQLEQFAISNVKSLGAIMGGSQRQTNWNGGASTLDNVNDGSTQSNGNTPAGDITPAPNQPGTGGH